MKNTRTRTKEFLGKTYVAGAMLSLFVALSFYNTVLVADEVFVIFAFGPELVADPTKIWSWALSSSVGGWATGRFVSPLSHVLSNTGVFLNEVTAIVLSIDQIQAYSFWRVLMLVAICLSTMKLLHTLLSGSQVKQSSLFLVMAIASIVIPSGFVTNRAFSAIRAFTWSYGVLTIAAIWLTIALFSLAIKRRDDPKLRRYIDFFVGVVALLFATTYELTQALAPVALLVSNYFLWKHEDRNLPLLKKLKSVLISRFNLIFVIFFSLPFLFIRIDSLNKCVGGCYQTASLNPGGFSIDQFFGRTVSAFPTIAQTVGFQYEPEWLGSGANVAALLAAFVLGLLVILWLLVSLTRTGFSHVESSDIKNLSIIGLTGLGFVTVISIGMSLSVAVQEGALTLGASSRDSLILSIGMSLILCYLFAVCFNPILTRQLASKVPRLMIAVILVAALLVNFALTFVSNSIVTRTTQNSGGAFMQSALASAVSHPDTTEQGDNVRCALVLQKIMNFPEWEGHDRIIVYGLNLSFQRKIGVDFCSRSIDELFENYPLK
jgi:hypothetical protein